MKNDVAVEDGLAAGAAEEEAAVPTYTLRADRQFDMRAMVELLRLARDAGTEPEKRAELENVVREWELYEEKHRG